MATVNGYLTSLLSDLYVNGNERDKIKTSIDAIKTRLGWYFGTSEHNVHKIIEKIFLVHTVEIQCFQENMMKNRT